MERLSTLMRKGAAMSPKADGFIFDEKTGGTCALGAVLLAMGHCRKENLNWEWMSRVFDAFGDHGIMLESRNALCPRCGISGKVGELIPHLNNSAAISRNNLGHGMPREWIADWIEKTFETPREIKEREDGIPPPVPASEIRGYVGLSSPISAQVFHCNPFEYAPMPLRGPEPK